MIIFVQEEVGGGGAGRVEFAFRMSPEERGKEKGKTTKIMGYSTYAANSLTKKW
jgi:hypothetical protein